MEELEEEMNEKVKEMKEEETEDVEEEKVKEVFSVYKEVHLSLQSAIGFKVLKRGNSKCSIILSLPLAPYFPSYPKFLNKVQTSHFIGRRLLWW